jgi:hypothetical protein
MCGINGAFAYHYAANPIEHGELVAVRDHMIARGPDGAGLWMAENARVGFGHRRLAIIDLSPSGHQPMSSADGRYVVTFNGEVYKSSRPNVAWCRRWRMSTGQDACNRYTDRPTRGIGNSSKIFAKSLPCRWSSTRHSTRTSRSSVVRRRHSIAFCGRAWMFLC